MCFCSSDEPDRHFILLKMESQLLLLLLLWRRHQIKRNYDASHSINTVAEEDEEDEMLHSLLLSNKKFRSQQKQESLLFHTSWCNSKTNPSKKIPRSCLQHPIHSSWKTLYNGRNDGAMITLTGLDCNSFDQLNHEFEPYFDGLPPHINNGYIKVIKKHLEGGV